MCVLKAILFAFILSLSVFPSNQGLAQTTAEKAPVAEVPMLFRGTMPAVEVMINGQGPFLFAIDTAGQGMARVDSSLVERLKLPLAGQIQASDGSGRNARSLNMFMLDSIAIGGVQFKGVR